MSTTTHRPSDLSPRTAASKRPALEGEVRSALGVDSDLFGEAYAIAEMRLRRWENEGREITPKNLVALARSSVEIALDTHTIGPHRFRWSLIETTVRRRLSGHGDGLINEAISLAGQRLGLISDTYPVTNRDGLTVKVSRHASMEALDQERRQQLPADSLDVDEDFTEHPADPRPVSEERVVFENLLTRVRLDLDELDRVEPVRTAPYRHVFELSAQDGLSTREIAKALGVKSPQTIANRPERIQEVIVQ